MIENTLARDKSIKNIALFFENYITIWNVFPPTRFKEVGPVETEDWKSRKMLKENTWWNLIQLIRLTGNWLLYLFVHVELDRQFGHQAGRGRGIFMVLVNGALQSDGQGGTGTSVH